MDARLLPLVAEHTAPTDRLAAPSPRVASALRRAGHRLTGDPLDELRRGSVDLIALLDDELSSARDRAETLVAAAREALRPGGLLVASARNRVYAAATGIDLGSERGFSAGELAGVAGHEGFTIERLLAPGAASGLTGGRTLRTDLDAEPGLRDAAPRTVVVARSPADAAARTHAFFASLPRKIVAAAVVCRDDQGRLLVVHDSFRREWTLPGGVVHADEDPRHAAEREAWEEAGVRVRAGALLGVFPGSRPDRVALVYAAEPTGRAPEDPSPVHTHEITAVGWWPLDEALERLSADAAARVRTCLSL